MPTPDIKHIILRVDGGDASFGQIYHGSGFALYPPYKDNPQSITLRFNKYIGPERKTADLREVKNGEIDSAYPKIMKATALALQEKFDCLFHLEWEADQINQKITVTPDKLDLLKAYMKNITLLISPKPGSGQPDWSQMMETAAQELEGQCRKHALEKVSGAGKRWTPPELAPWRDIKKRENPDSLPFARPLQAEDFHRPIGAVLDEFAGDGRISFQEGAREALIARLGEEIARGTYPKPGNGWQR